ncbi:phosphatidylinositol 3 and 4-kinase family protein [Aspergillus steynii IBT 23096]|uniref:Serine/threonine-protein kinase TOR n=1 Tax=Aspergillus steynii IBT 23096 TaxID=1392250 RepID=A0A2I2GDA5_9EURO|nr:phosphatidylinositol 3 and 4-kinase family protein [Aspergillus steynii IBT 23096]PLB50852.1 phosphatidylinositol 3 and 4-kinase family protein [Aspergillus steynii IBT 23096]
MGGTGIDPLLTGICEGLKSKNKTVQGEACKQLRDQVTLVIRDKPTEQLREFCDTVCRSIGQLILHGDPNETLAGLLALDSLTDVIPGNAAQVVPRFASFLNRALQNDDPRILISASKSLGRLVPQSEFLAKELVRSEVRSALEWLQSEGKTSNRLLAAFLIIKALADNAPGLMLTHAVEVFEFVWIGLRDSDPLVRVTASEATGECLSLASARDKCLGRQWYNRFHEDILLGLQSSDVQWIIGSLLLWKKLSIHRGILTNERYKITCHLILLLSSHRNSQIQEQLIKTLPALAIQYPAVFAHNYLQPSMAVLKAQLKSSKERDAVFYTIGEMVIALGDAMTPYLSDISNYLREGLRVKGKHHTHANDTSILSCIRSSSLALGPTFSIYAQGLIGPMLTRPLTQELRDSLETTAEHIPSLKPSIQEDTLALLDKILLARDNGPRSDSKTNWPGKAGTKDNCTLTHQSEETIVFALKVLGDFDFGCLSTHDLVCRAMFMYVEHDNSEVRKTAALTCCRYLLSELLLKRPHIHRIPSDVIRRLISLAMGDPDPNIREAVLLAFSSDFDRWLAQPEHIRSLFLGINDESFPVRTAAMCILGRLSSINPAYVLPSLRKVLLNLLTGLMLTKSVSQRLEILKMINAFAANSTSLLEAYVPPILDVLLPRAIDDSEAVATATLEAIGNLFKVAGPSMREYGSRLMPNVLCSLASLTSNTRREAALEAISQIVQSSGSTIHPYVEYPELLPALTKMVKVEEVESIRLSTIRLLGTLGALDPVKCFESNESTLEMHRVNQAPKKPNSDYTMRPLDLNDTEHYRIDVFDALLNNVLAQTSLKRFHPSAIDAMVMVCKVTGMACVSFLDRVIPCFISVIQASSHETLGYYFSRLSALVDVIGAHIRPYLSDVIKTIQSFWDKMNQAPLASLIETLSIHMGNEMKGHLSALLPLMIATLEIGASSAAQRVLHLIASLGGTVEEYMHCIIPALLQLISSSSHSTELRKSAIDCVTDLSDEVDFSDHASSIIHTLTGVLAGKDHVLVHASMECLCALVHIMGPDFICYTRAINRTLTRHNIVHDGYSTLVPKLQNGESLPSRSGSRSLFERSEAGCARPHTRQKELNINLKRLKNAWDTSRVSTTRDWQQWMQELTMHLLEESSCPTVRACANLAELYYPLGKSLFNTAFASCWTALPQEYQQSLSEALNNAFISPTAPHEIVSTLLNLAEFMDRTDKVLPIRTQELSYHAMKSHAYAKALRYEELHFDEEQNMQTLETLMAINNNLQQPDSAHGILRTSHELGNSGTQENWLENLHYWKTALTSYEQREKARPSTEDEEDWSITLGKIRCLHALQDWQALSGISEEKWSHASLEHQRAIAPLAVTAAWRLKNWDLIQTLLHGIKPGTADRSFFGAVLAVHHDEFDIAAVHISEAQKRLDPELTVMLDESYGRSYDVLVRLQMLAELDEIIIYKKSRDSEKRRQIHEMWNQRLLGCQRSVEVWQRILNLRALSGCSVLEDLAVWIKFANMCRKENHLKLAESTIRSIEEATSDAPRLSRPEIKLARLKIDWQLGCQREALDGLKLLTKELEQQLSHAKGSMSPAKESGCVNSFANPRKVVSKCYRTLAIWQTALNQGDWTEKKIDAILGAYHASMTNDRNSYKACHVWALAAYKTARLTARDASPSQQIPESTLRGFIITAIEALYKSISLSSTSPLQDVLRILNLWFKHGNDREVINAIIEGFSLIGLDAWLGVSPQLVARITSPTQLVRASVQRLLTEVAKSHPQALIYPLTVAMKSRVARRSGSACDIIGSMRRHSPTLVLQADVVSHELIRVAALWYELWFEGLEDASRMYFSHKNIHGMFRILQPLHAMMEAGPVTLNEVAFVHSFGRSLTEANHYCLAYLETDEIGHLNHAWSLYSSVYRRIRDQRPLMLQLDLGTISPKLKTCENLDIVVPGTYRNQPSSVVKVVRFDPNLQVFQSKKRPRKLKIVGDDGNVYLYLLKGQEDIRQDERVMQLFGLVNTLFAGDSDSVQRQLVVQPFPAIPLSQSSGLLGWVSNSDTFHGLVKEYRETRQIPVNLEYQLMLRMSSDYDKLPLLAKVEVFQNALANTKGKDLYQVLWLRNTSSEAWLSHRTHYTRSLAVMSIVGYILGLGDRHPSNLLLHRHTGNIVHVDFGDCFDVASQRDNYPERVPFRLTRMLVVAMGVGNLEGNFRAACEIVMRVLRTHKDSIMTILAAFLHDPLLNWQMGSHYPTQQPGEVDHLADLAQSTPVPSSHMSSVIGAGVLDPQPQQGVNNNTAAGEGGLNAYAIEVLTRVRDKLTGRDFRKGQLEVEDQVRKLIEEATNLENLCQHYIGWCSHW